jgi:serine/threonine protein kinase
MDVSGAMERFEPQKTPVMIGTTVGHYRITARLGAGGMGEVFLAEDTRLDRQAAIKFLPANLAQDPERRQRFLTEAKAASALNHAHVCVVYDVGETSDGVPFIAMEFVEGQSLGAIVKPSSLGIAAVVSIVIQVADALDAAHARRIVHRDIKPDNICLNERREVKVLDFGLAKRMLVESTGALGKTADMPPTLDGQILGTPNYMSPEQALGKTVDHRSDLFSLGSVIYYLLTGRPPFAGDNLGEVLDNVIHRQPDAIARFNYDVPPELERITLKLLAKDVDRRYQSARELLVDLQNLKQSLDGGGSRMPAGERPGVTGQHGSRSQINRTQIGPIPTVEEVKASDIFISCAELDDQPLAPGREGWVSQFQRNLKVRLEQLFGDRVKVASLPMPPGRAPADENYFQHLPDAKTMVSVVSPPFTKSEGCQRGVEEFWHGAERSGNFWVESKPRLFKVVKTPVNDRDLPPKLDELFAQLMAFEFYERDAETGRLREFDEAFGEDARARYYERIYDLAYEIAQVLKYQRSAAAGETTPGAGKKIYLAETTTDLVATRDKLQRELREQGHAVLPDRPLPLNAGQLQTAIRSYLEHCDLAIHLVGQRYGLVPEDTDRSVVALQNQLAAERSALVGLERLIWMPRNLQPVDDRQAEFVRQLVDDPAAHRGADVIADTLENLKEILESRWRREAQAAQARAMPGTAVPRVYLICDRDDESAVEPLEDFFYAEGIEVSLPDFGTDEAAVGEIHRQNLEDCDAVLVYYGAGSKSWVDIKLRDLLKALGYRNGRPIAQQAVYVAPPPDRRKERFKTLSAEVITQTRETFDPALLAAFAGRIKG